MRKLCILCNLVILILVTGCSQSPETLPDQPTATMPVETMPDQPTATMPVETIYAGDNMINLFLNNFNKANPDTPITSEMAKSYYHHGSEHENQIKFSMNDFEVVISGIANLEVVIMPINQMNKKSADEYEIMFLKYAKGYNPSLSDEALSEYWQQILNDNMHHIEIDEFECRIQIFNDEIEELIISGN